MARRRRPLALPDHPVTRRRLGLRRVGLLWRRIRTSGRSTISTGWWPRPAARGIRVLLDLVPNHTSDEHPWFLEAASSRNADRRDWYVWSDPKADGSPPNNWVSSFGGPAWTFHPETGQYFLHNHLAQQPDLNWWNEDVRDAFDAILRFWLDRGIAGFRIDVCNIIIKDAELRDNPPATEDDDFEAQMFGQRSVYNANRPEVHEVHQALARPHRDLRRVPGPDRRDPRARRRPRLLLRDAR